MRTINKSVFIKSLDCQRLAWHLYRNLIARDNSLGDNFLIFESKKIHALAQQLFPKGLKVNSNSLQEALDKTKELIFDKNIQTIFEPLFEYNGFVAKADILCRTEDGWQIVEVKSGNKGKRKYIVDMAYSSLIISKNLESVSKVKLLLLSKDFHLGLPIENLFTETDFTVEVFIKMQEYSLFLDDVKKMIGSENSPEAKLKLCCKNCRMFKQCLGKNIEYHIFDLPRLSHLEFDELCKMNINQIKDIPNEIELTEPQKIVKESIINDKVFVSPNLAVEIEKIQFPVYYLDFESVMTIYPLYENIHPHTQIVTQYSLHRSNDLNTEPEHFEFIADHTKDDRQALAEQLIKDIGEIGSIITYSSFERQILHHLAQLYPQLSENLNKIIDRIVDLEVILKSNYYDKNFHGKTSIKKVLPVMIPNMNYNELEISEGGSASSAFAYMAMGLYDQEKIIQTKKYLLEYCKQDTLALVRMHSFLAKLIQY
jgi:predicted RecB family nuclease